MPERKGPVPQDVNVRFWAKVDKSSGADSCWEWQASLRDKGYGQFCWKGRPLKAHRVAYELAIGQIPEGMCVLHKCDNPGCVNPAHLWLGTIADNNADMTNKGRRVSTPQLGEAHWHARLTTEDVIAIRQEYASGIPQGTIAQKYGVGRNNISMIVTRSNWRHVP